MSFTERVIVLLRDEKTLIGILRSLDQFNNLVLQNTVERISIGDKFGDIPRGLYIVRGDTVVLVGEMVKIYYNSTLITYFYYSHFNFCFYLKFVGWSAGKK